MTGSIRLPSFVRSSSPT
ncbi:hypothetical protein EYZ11_011388 [Aspergillus tanneri]|uniref:Uncharacterized protein n=1 Tax=Aspergillus tanneri TaxID=1220188 RepID=A0A4S3J895_9EURO|nr:hypothetical protein EYZ11_011388 [Aspergillus tanneri]